LIISWTDSKYTRSEEFCLKIENLIGGGMYDSYLSATACSALEI
jgi:hypothetical protein